MFMRKKIGCLHAHYSNVEYIEKAFSKFEIDWLHFVDPGLMYRMASEKTFTFSDAQKRVKDQVEWIAASKVDVILITCTNYIALLNEKQLSLSTPIIKIDEPYFEQICQLQQPQVMLFTNPATVEGTVKRLHEYARNHGGVDVEIIIIDHAFELIMQGLSDKYNQEIMNCLQQLTNEKRPISVAQLSMVNAAMSYEHQTGNVIVNPLQALVDFMASRLELSVS
ncbi:hypothetical protein GW626_10480 [Peribacillus muralis]|uniref:hypothetical protein n=1 Tax=Peribacillus muralis TaxID=264697 RepID=UPI001F4D88FF|nr:hypothetical protein [Peribacillus muralis]MCK1993510.1 hypothetical protein [Peribacillus muralis]MCK2014202.1 hypothetical protein [Peribacillus muralis]